MAAGGRPYPAVVGPCMGRDGRAAGVVGMAIAVASFGLTLAALLRWVDQGRLNEPSDVEGFTVRWVALPTPATAAPAATAPAGFQVQAQIPASAAATHGGPSQEPQDGLTVGCVVDSLTIATFIVVTLLNVLVHLFALGLMNGQGERGRFFAWLAWLNLRCWACCWPIRWCRRWRFRRVWPRSS